MDSTRLSPEKLNRRGDTKNRFGELLVTLVGSDRLARASLVNAGRLKSPARQFLSIGFSQTI
jgi:hypothetical protein